MTTNYAQRAVSYQLLSAQSFALGDFRGAALFSTIARFWFGIADNDQYYA